MDDAIERLEWDERKEDETPAKTLAPGHPAYRADRRRRGDRRDDPRGVRRAAAARARARRQPRAAAARPSIFGSSKSYHFTLVNHVTTNSFFTPTQNGAADACKLLGCSYTWTGLGDEQRRPRWSTRSTARSAPRPTASRSSLIDPTAFNAPVQTALAAGIPVVAYNADEPQTGRLAYIGQDLFVSGQQMGEHIVGCVPSRRDRAVHRHAGRGQHPAADRRRARTRSRATPSIKPTWSRPARRCRPS